MNPELFEKIEKLPLYIDGSDGSIWPSRSDVATAMTDPMSAARHYVRLSDLLEVMSAFEALASLEAAANALQGQLTNKTNGVN